MPARRRLIIFAALRALNSALRRGLDACAACGFASPAWDEPLIFTALRALGSALRRSLGRLCGAQQGGAGYGASPPSRPPLHPPPEAPPKRAYNCLNVARARVCAAGASLARSARSGDLPSRRVNARIHFRFECYSASASNLSPRRRLNDYG